MRAADGGRGVACLYGNYAGDNMNVAMAMTPRSDYPQVAELLPWCLKQAGLEKYDQATKDAIAEVGMAKTRDAAPEQEPADAAVVTCTVSDPKLFEDGVAVFSFRAGGTADPDAERMPRSWPGAGSQQMSCVLPAGPWFAFVSVGDEANRNWYVYHDGAWEQCESPKGTPEEYAVTLEAGKTFELSSKGLEAIAMPEQAQNAA